ncbi:MAG: hypothetical protein OEV59_02440 [Deltaproteobacteria bacterium]|nr:hypothetical protein [Deltaproteobacteria bacterium]
MLKRISVFFAAGAVGGLVNALLFWAAGMGDTKLAFGYKVSSKLSEAYLLPKIVWGGVWAMLFFLPFPKDWSTLRKGLIVSVVPSALQLFYVYPFVMDKGVLGIELGYTTPAFVLAFNAVWGLAAGYWAFFSGEKV